MSARRPVVVTGAGVISPLADSPQGLHDALCAGISGLKPIDCLHILKGRIMSSHLKDLNEFGNPRAHDLPYGTGVSDVKAILDELKRQGFKGHVSIEYEYHQDNPAAEIKECVDYVKDKYGK